MHDPGYRTATSDLHGPCPSCGNDAWLDLAREEVVLSLAERESVAARKNPRGWAIQAVSVVGLGSAGLFLGAILVSLLLGTGAMLPAGLTALFTVLAGVAIVQRVYELGGPPRRRSRPMRWRYALPSTEAPRIEHQPVVLSGAPLVAPLSGRVCLGYEVGLRDDDDPRGHLGTWAFVEQATAPLSASGQSLPAGSVWLEFAQRTRYPLDGAPDRARVVRYLRERGFSPDGVVLFETVLPVDANVIARSDHGRVVVRG